MMMFNHLENQTFNLYILVNAIRALYLFQLNIKIIWKGHHFSWQTNDIVLLLYAERQLLIHLFATVRHKCKLASVTMN